MLLSTVILPYRPLWWETTYSLSLVVSIYHTITSSQTSSSVFNLIPLLEYFFIGLLDSEIGLNFLHLFEILFWFPIQAKINFKTQLPTWKNNFEFLLSQIASSQSCLCYTVHDFLLLSLWYAECWQAFWHGCIIKATATNLNREVVSGPWAVFTFGNKFTVLAFFSQVGIS